MTKGTQMEAEYRIRTVVALVACLLLCFATAVAFIAAAVLYFQADAKFAILLRIGGVALVLALIASYVLHKFAAADDKELEQ